MRVLVLTFTVIFVCLAISSSLLNAAPVDNLVLYLTFDEGNGEVAKDLSVSKNNGVLKGSPKWVKGKTGSALQFNGAENKNYVEVPEHPGLNPAEQITCAAWIYFDKFLGSGGIISKYIGAGNQRGYTMHQHHDNALSIGADFSSDGIFKAGVSAVSSGTDAGTLKEGEWQHVAMTFKAKDTAKIFINGVMKAEAKADFMANIFDNTVPLLVGTDFQIGGSHRAGQPREFTGIIDEVAIFNRALSEDEIKSIMGGVMGASTVESYEKLATKWGNIKN